MTTGGARTSVPDLPADGELRSWGIDPDWSRHVDVAGHDGQVRRWHVLERRPASGASGATSDQPSDQPTVVCIHGNPTWAYLWRPFLERLGDRWRVLAPDQLGMGYSERTDPRRYADRVRDLDDLLIACGVDGPVVLVGHDWGGAIAMGWAVEHADRVVAMVLANTGIAVPGGREAPRVIRLAATRGVLDLVCRRTPLFLRGTSWLSRDRLTATDRTALSAPYRSAERRTAIADFVADVPFGDAHPSSAAIGTVAARLGDLDVPVLLAWGAADPVFDDDFAADLGARLRRTDLHRYPAAGHLVPLEEDVARVADEWLTARLAPRGEKATATATDAPDGHRPLWSALEARRDDAAVAFHDAGAGRSVSFAELARMVEAIAGGLAARGIRPGDRIAMLVPPSVELIASAYACWRVGAVTVIADRGLGLRGLGRAVRGARVDHVLGPPRALAAARILRWAPGAGRISLDDVAQMVASGRSAEALPDPPPDADAAVLFTSGATGPAKGVRYTHAALAAQRDALATLYETSPDDRFVAAFAPFALYGPALGICSAVPDADVTAPGQLTAAALDDACAAIEATMVFASPAALANVVATADGPMPALARTRLVMSAGAPVPVTTLRRVAALAPLAELHTPYGMTEVLPVADVDLAGIERAGTGEGVCVGFPVEGCRVRVGDDGEIEVAAAWMSAGYDRLWATEHRARPRDADGTTWHRTGDVGHLDAEGRVWVEGRTVHVIDSGDGPITPVPVELAVERLDGVTRSAAVGIGPAGVQLLVVVVEGDADGLADTELTERVRGVVAHPVAAVCTMRTIPVDIRHNAKVDRTAVAAWATRLLSGGWR